MKHFFIFSILLISTPSMPKELKQNIDIHLFDDDNWIGEEKFLKILKENNIKKCDYFNEKSIEYKKSALVLGKVLKLLRNTNCSNRFKIAEELLLYNNDMKIKLSALRLVNSFSKGKKKSFKKAINRIKRSTPNTLSFKNELKTYFNSIED